MIKFGSKGMLNAVATWIVGMIREVEEDASESFWNGFLMVVGINGWALVETLDAFAKSFLERGVEEVVGVSSREKSSEEEGQKAKLFFVKVTQ